MSSFSHSKMSPFPLERCHVGGDGYIEQGGRVSVVEAIVHKRLRQSQGAQRLDLSPLSVRGWP